ncbi:MAG: PRD domain-containing protein, partial [Oscillospiraceae bacterium]|nr:PRD domain-containing protein [Oscillospiraceae bacterium]
MRAIRRLNNNAVVCRDSTGREVIALGKGIGFGDIPRDLALHEVERTFYDMDATGMNVMSDLPAPVVMFAARIIDIASNELSYPLSPNAVLLLADHINFALERLRKNIRVQMPLAYDVQQMYPAEYKLGEYTVNKIRREFKVGLATEEAAGIAMNFINARAVPENRPREDFSIMLEEVTELIENHFHIMVDRNSFNFSRYATHLQ